MLYQVEAAEQALRERARVAQGEEKAKAERHAEILVQTRREFEEGPFTEGAIGNREQVDALLEATDALRFKKRMQPPGDATTVLSRPIGRPRPKSINSWRTPSWSRIATCSERQPAGGRCSSQRYPGWSTSQRARVMHQSASLSLSAR